MGRARIRMEDFEAREVECDRLRARGADGQRGRRADEPRRFSKGRRDEGGSAPRRVRDGVRRVLSVRRRSGGSRETRDHRRDSAGRIGARRGRDRGGGPVEPGDGVHRRPALPALKKLHLATNEHEFTQIMKRYFVCLVSGAIMVCSLSKFWSMKAAFSGEMVAGYCLSVPCRFMPTAI